MSDAAKLKDPRAAERFSHMYETLLQRQQQLHEKEQSEMSAEACTTGLTKRLPTATWVRYVSDPEEHQMMRDGCGYEYASVT